MPNKTISGDRWPAELPARQLWSRFCDTLEQAYALVDVADEPTTPFTEAAGLRYLTRLFAGGTRLCVELADPDYPQFGRMVDTTLSWGIDNPDCIYLYAAVAAGRTYRIHGKRGTAHFLDLQINRGHFADAPDFGVVAALTGEDLQVADDGSVELILGGPRQPGNWLPLPQDTQWMLLRQYFYDWESERPADLIIEREGATYPPPVATPEQSVEQLERLRRWFDVGGRFWDEMALHSYSNGPNTLFFRGLDETSWGGMQGLAYGFGNFRCDPDEAVVLEVAPPSCRYWSFSLANRYWETLEWAQRQSSLNGFQAPVDADGVFRAVIAHRDPGVANWLDPAGHTAGTMMGRYLLTDSVPQPVLTRMPLADLDKALPECTPRLDAAGRAVSLDRRRRAAWRRNRH